MLFAILLLDVAITIGTDHFFIESPLSQLITGLLAGLTIVVSIVYVYRISARVGKRQ